jgi:hypothetical protein
MTFPRVTFSFLLLRREVEPIEGASSVPLPAVAMRIVESSALMSMSRDSSPVICSLAPESMIQRFERATSERCE